ncbi:uncharacterized protein LOC135689070 [Rhopilema esculentum]|uniref:uncharacterized protein LOC135689070 n=1 Tax=Rhopilema esculentum TaxID=499914 RepID=UPI0031D58B8D|eukprot:gene7532-13313_t
MAIYEALESVLYRHCCPEIVVQYEIMDNEPRKRLLDALSGYCSLQVFENSFELPQNYQKKIDLYFQTLGNEKLLGGMLLLDKIAIAFGRWGKAMPPKAVLARHSECVAINQKEGSSLPFPMNLYFLYSDPAGNNCTDFSTLHRVFIKDLKLFEKSKGKFIEGTIITRPIVLHDITTILEDAQGDVIQLRLFNMVPSCRNKTEVAEKKFPVNAKIKIAEPYLKVFADSNQGIRVDCPEEVCILQQTTADFEQILENGKFFTDNGDFLAAFDIYIAGLAEFPEILLLLNNRCQAELKLKEYELAFLDAAAVLFLERDNEKGRLRYKKAAYELGFTLDNAPKMHGLWKRVLLKYNKHSLEEKVAGPYSREDGNNEYKEGDFSRAKAIYTSAMGDCNNVCKLLIGAALVSLKTEMYQTAISAASACFQLATDKKHRKQARFAMTKAFSSLGEIELARLAAMGDLSLLNLYDGRNNSYRVVANALNKSCPITLEANRNVKVPSDYLCPDTMEHCYISGKGRGLRAKRGIFKGELLVVDHPIVSQGTKSSSSAIFVDESRQQCYFASEINLESKLVSLVKYNGLLAKKLLLLDRKRDGTKADDLPLISDLEWMAYRKLNDDVPPFLPQTPEEAGVDKSLLTPDIIRNVISNNCFKWGWQEERIPKEVALALTVSFFNHDDDPNCSQFPVGDALTIVAVEDIQKGEELTIMYRKRDEMAKWVI